ncbi:MAG: hypothetical protein CMB80_23485 [Flammeovirgaceae bacterium]|nr:hypothetical protein [Flammeovirgaceae bacterium]HCX23790.1 hypothetical protein [Cytophagales bacterium]|tara:strand:- start:133 stop:546 length:414 start_codon:yes stop_codon:yes gene_type:complete
MISAINYKLNPAIYSIVAEDIIEPTSTTPFVKYDKRANCLTIKGTSTRKNMSLFYSQVLGDFKYGLRIKGSGELNLQLSKFGTSTLKVLFDLFRFIGKEQELGTQVRINWNVLGAEPEMIETVRDFAELFNLKLKIR